MENRTIDSSLGITTFAKGLTFPACLPMGLGNYTGSCQVSINITGKASLSISQASQAVGDTPNTLH